ncbi:hypothetical protein [Novosphingobium sp.]|uniref:hypothetical protein n=1 Tax=Novosphingobium sp. TaxID=1874826 RepID=UPI0027376DF4|nr:hypothetical protein [Novosphingobium sp.]MDP3908718.1 hypothetical protein [Novosphingobium sp.]
MAALVLTALITRADAALRDTPGWWDPDGVGAGSDWHYRVAVTLPAGSSVNSTAKVDIDFAALMTQLGISGTFDTSPVRVVRPSGTLAATQEYNDSIYAGATDTSATRGEVRWLVEDGGTQTYFVYFDITQNGSKAASTLPRINGNFEHSAAGTQLPTGWTSATRSNPAYDAQVRPAETVSVTSDGAPLHNPRNTNGNPRTGAYSYLLGARTDNEPALGGSQIDTTVLTREIAVPATDPGNLTVNWRAEGWDSEGYDSLTISVVTSGGAVTEIVGNSLASYSAYPNSPAIGGGAADALSAGFGHYNGFDMNTIGTHTAGMTVAYNAEVWWTRRYSLAAFAGQTVTLRISANNTELYRTWFHIDDVEWSVVSGTLGNPQAFGAVATSPLGNLAPDQSVRVLATVDARPTGAGDAVLADLYYPAGSPYLTGVVLHDDGAHGDGAANDAVWGSSQQTIPLSTPSGTGWLVRVYARDASTSTFGAASNGLMHRNGLAAPLTMANWWNIDERNFAVQGAAIEVAKTMALVSDGVNMAEHKAIPEARVRYCITITNSGPASAGTVLATDPLPAALTYAAGSLRSGATCASAATLEDDDAVGADDDDPTGASLADAIITISRPTLNASSSFAVTYEATVN